MTHDFEIGPPAGDAESEAFARLFMEALMGAVPAGTEWLESVRTRVFGLGDVRIAREHGAVVGGLGVFDFGQYWGARSLRCGGVSVVAVAPEVRGRGAARALMTRALRESRESGRSIAALYPATQGLYRKLGFELAGSGLMLRVPIQRFDTKSAGLAVRTFRAEDLDAVKAVYAERAATHDGWLDRSDGFWRQRVLHTYTGPANGVVVLEGDRIDGYMFYTQKPNARRHYDLAAVDVSARTQRAWAQLGSFIAGHRSMADGLVYRSGAHQLPFGALDEVGDVTVEQRLDWMLRVLDVPAALRGRGYLPGLRGDVRFAVRDAMFSENEGAWHLRVGDEDGRGAVERCASADVTLDVRGLAALFAGYHSAHDVAMLGLAEGNRAALARLGGLFSGRPPGLPDMF